MADIIQNQPTKAGAKKGRLSVAKVKVDTVLLAATVIVLALIGAGYWYQHAHNSKLASQPLSYNYSLIQQYKLKAPTAGSGMAFDLPVEYKAGDASAAGTEQAQFSHALIKNNKPITISNLAVASVYTASTSPASYLKSLNQYITDPKNPSHAVALKPIHSFVTDRVDSGYNFSWAAPVAAPIPHVKSNIWAFNFTATAKDPKKASSLPPLAGEALLAVGQKTFYYYFVDAVSYNWKANSNFWQKQVIDTLRIDQ